MASSQEEMQSIPHSELKDLEVIGAGGYGIVYRAKHARFGTVVYKELNTRKLRDRTEHELQKEARMRILCHINIVALFATVLDIGHYGIVMEHVLYGALNDYVFDHYVDWPLKLWFAHGIVCGMNYLHSLQPPVIHSDLKIENILVSDELQAKICDFGLAKWKQQAATQTTTGRRCGTIAYMAPEVFIDGSCPRTVKYDVYSFGILLWALLSEKEPFENAINDEQLKTMVKQGNRPPLNTITGPGDLQSFAERWIVQCWQQLPDERPSFDDLEMKFVEIRQLEAANPVCRPFLRQIKLVHTYRVSEISAIPRPFRWLLPRMGFKLPAHVVSGVACLDNIMYVVCAASSTIQLYNMDTYSPLDVVIKVDGFIGLCPLDIVVCRHDRQLYVADWCNNCIWRVSVDDKSYVKWLSMAQSLTDILPGFTVTSLSLMSRRLIVTSSLLPPSLRQYDTTDTQLLCVVSLPGYMKELHHGVETTHSTFIVAHKGTVQDKEQDAVSEVDVTGQVLSTFTDVTGFLNLSLDSEGRVLVADFGNAFYC